jgi:hypothetical protein
MVEGSAYIRHLHGDWWKMVKSNVAFCHRFQTITAMRRCARLTPLEWLLLSETCDDVITERDVRHVEATDGDGAIRGID